MPTLFTFRIAGADFLSGRMANSPEYERKNIECDTILHGIFLCTKKLVASQTNTVHKKLYINCNKTEDDAT